MVYKSIPPLKDTGDCDDGEFRGFRGDSEPNNGRIRYDVKMEIEGYKETPDAYGEET